MSQRHKYVIVKNKSYGNALKGTKIYFEGKKPKGLRDDGTIQFGKHILQAIKVQTKGKPFRWILTPTEDSLRIERNIIRVRTSAKTLAKMGSEMFGRSRDIKLDIVAEVFAATQPELFKGKKPVAPLFAGRSRASPDR